MIFEKSSEIINWNETKSKVKEEKKKMEFLIRWYDPSPSWASWCIDDDEKLLGW